MVKLTTDDAKISKQPSGEVYVTHPTNGAILAYCNSEAEARDVVELLNDLARQLRGLGHKAA
jgi:hypothetical protein